MNVAVRVDASSSMGTGHLVRCRTLARALREGGASVQFACRRHPGNAIAQLRADGFTVSALPPPTGEESAEHGAVSDDYACWLGVPQQQDAAEFIAALQRRPDWIVVDQYGLNIEWERRLRPHGDRILVIDDLANRIHDCDVLLDQNYVRNPEVRYHGLVSEHTRRLLGPRYALLRPEYAEYRRTLAPRDGQVRRVLLFFGGTDPYNLTGRTLEALTNEGLRHLEVDAVVGANNPHRELLLGQAMERGGTRIHDALPHLADLMAAADVAVGAGGATTWERCCLGLPSLVVSIADNQRPACEALAEAGLISYVGHWDAVSVDDLRDGTMGLIHDPGRLRKMAAVAQEVVDGAGTRRVVDHLLSAA